LQDGIPLYRVERIRHVDGQDDPVWIIAAGINKSLEAHANHLGSTPHCNSTLSGLQGANLLLHLVQSQQAFSNNTPQRVTNRNGAHGAVLFPQWDEIGGAEDGAGTLWQPMLDAELGKGSQRGLQG
jgi:hypothetical protein